MTKRIIIFGLLLLGALSNISLAKSGPGAVDVNECESIGRPARISPDYSSTVIPPNIAPLNFLVQEKGSDYLVKIHSDKDGGFEVSSQSPGIHIPQDYWHKLLEKSRGEQLYFDVFVKKDSRKWVRFQTITNKIAREDTDNYLVYRKTHPTYILTQGRVGIFQRDLRNYDEKIVLDNSHDKSGCVNCHTFCGNRPDKVLISVRNVKYGPITLLIDNDTAYKIRAKLGYTTWHPSGKLAAYSLNKLPMLLHTAREETRDTVDIDSVLAYYVFGANAVRTTPQISRLDMLETWPTWSADGRYLYFCRTPMTWTDQNKFPPNGWEKIKYDLVRISYDLEQDKWGEVEKVLSAEDTGLSPRCREQAPTADG